MAKSDLIAQFTALATERFNEEEAVFDEWLTANGFEVKEALEDYTVAELDAMIEALGAKPEEEEAPLEPGDHMGEFVDKGAELVGFEDGTQWKVNPETGKIVEKVE